MFLKKATRIESLVFVQFLALMAFYLLQRLYRSAKGPSCRTTAETLLKRFILCPSVAECSYCNPNPKPTEMIVVTLEGDLRARYTTHEIRVGGKFIVDLAAPDGVPYRLEADFLRQ